MGEGLADLEALGRSGERVLGSRLAQIADGIQQVIWGEFRACREQTATEPFVRVIAFDGSCFEVWSDDNGVIGRVQAAFGDAEPIPPPAF